MGAGQAMKRIPRIKFPQRHPKSSGMIMELIFSEKGEKHRRIALNVPDDDGIRDYRTIQVMEMPEKFSTLKYQIVFMFVFWNPSNVLLYQMVWTVLALSATICHDEAVYFLALLMQYLKGKVHSPTGTTNQADGLSAHDLKNDDLVMKFFSRAPSAASGGKASDQPKELLFLKTRLTLSCWVAVSNVVEENIKLVK
ncbi:hypothetical protein SASPL_151185 [Salvia splendens]|uniref:Uncharacterized protein n=1 Tax=Salvia splendens TaxID=180675 RepID=A0A8X8Z2F8_SALSN|nr:hypothetical protein SASPL_151185 [Salvia splendens]